MDSRGRGSCLCKWYVPETLTLKDVTLLGWHFLTNIADWLLFSWLVGRKRDCHLERAGKAAVTRNLATHS